MNDQVSNDEVTPELVTFTLYVATKRPQSADAVLKPGPTPPANLCLISTPSSAPSRHTAEKHRQTEPHVLRLVQMDY